MGYKYAVLDGGGHGQKLLQNMKDEDGGGSSELRTVANVIKAVVQAGILTLSWAFYYSSLWPGVFFCVLMCFISAFNFAILGICSEITGQRTYSAIWAHTVGEGLAWLVDVAVMSCVFGGVVAYLIVVGDFLPRGLSSIGVDSTLLQHKNAAILVTSALILPLNFLKDTSFLGYTSVLGVFGSLYTCMVLVVEAAEYDGQKSDWEAFTLRPGLFVMIPTVALAFNGHFNAPALYQQLQGRSPSRWMLVTVAAYSACFVITLACAVPPYIMLGSELAKPDRSNVLTAPVFQGKTDVSVAYLATTFSVSLGIPLFVQAVRDSLETLWLRDLPRGARDFGERLGEIPRRSVLSALVMATSCYTSMSIESLGLVNAINGTVSSVLVMFVLPSIMYLRCSGEHKQKGG